MEKNTATSERIGYVNSRLFRERRIATIPKSAAINSDLPAMFATASV